MTRSIQRWTQALLLLAVVMAVSGCSSSGSQFLGKWVRTSNPHETIEIIRNGDQFLILYGQDNKEKMAAIYKDGGLEVEGMGGALHLTYVKSSETILVGDEEFKREK
jgi:hypothetical protein